MGAKLSLGELSELIGAQLRGDSAMEVSGIAPLLSAQENEISFVSQTKFQSQLSETKAGAVVLKSQWLEKFGGNALIVDDPYRAYAKLSAIFDPRPARKIGIHPSAHVEASAKIDPSASVGANCSIGENVVIGAGCEIYPGVVISENSQLGKNVLLYSNVSIYSNVEIGDNVIIHSGTVIGSDGFGFAPSPDGWEKIHQLGGVRIGSNVEIGASTAIDRGALGDTVISDGVIIDNQVHLAHNVVVGENTAIAGCVGVAGSTVIGKNCTVAGMVAINGHIAIADNTHFHGGTIVTKAIEESGVYASASPLQNVKQWRRNSVRYTQLESLVDRIKKLEKAQQS